jgi:hypothetical protein
MQSMVQVGHQGARTGVYCMQSADNTQHTTTAVAMLLSYCLPTASVLLVY